MTCALTPSRKRVVMRGQNRRASLLYAEQGLLTPSGSWATSLEEATDENELEQGKSA